MVSPASEAHVAQENRDVEDAGRVWDCTVPQAGPASLPDSTMSSKGLWEAPQRLPVLENCLPPPLTQNPPAITLNSPAEETPWCPRRFV